MMFLLWLMYGTTKKPLSCENWAFWAGTFVPRGNLSGMRKMAILLAPAALYLAAGCGPRTPADLNSDVGGTELKATAQKGDAYDSEMQMQMTVKTTDKNAKTQQDTLLMKVETHSELISVEGGKFSWADTITDVQASGTGALQKAALVNQTLKGMRSIVTMDEHGKILDTKVENAPRGSVGNLSALQGFDFPEKPIKVGDSWESSQRYAGADIKMKHTVVEITDSVIKLDSALLNSSIATPSGAMHVEIDRKTLRPMKVDWSTETSASDVAITQTM